MINRIIICSTIFLMFVIIFSIMIMQIIMTIILSTINSLCNDSNAKKKIYSNKKNENDDNEKSPREMLRKAKLLKVYVLIWSCISTPSWGLFFRTYQWQPWPHSQVKSSILKLNRLNSLDKMSWHNAQPKHSRFNNKVKQDLPVPESRIFAFELSLYSAIIQITYGLS